MKCLETCRKLNVSCPVKECRSWVDYDEDRNCVHETVSKHGPLTLRETSERLGVSFVRIKQIEEKALKKLGKMIKPDTI
tara:strand:+ start:2089 stop:2325 length:237 start_codon:yes stop_codon:yes gene_type:complete